MGSLAMFWMDRSIFRRVIYRVGDLFRSPPEVPPRHERMEAELPSQGLQVSVEKALNSRCTSDYDGNPKRFHWGMFDGTKKLSEKSISEIVEAAKIPLVVDAGVDMQTKENLVTFVIHDSASERPTDSLMIESGMQQQAVGLVCAALGAGMVFRNLGRDGTRISERTYAAIRIKLDPMKPSYAGRFWSNDTPGGRLPVREGSLSEPERDGDQPLIEVLKTLKREEDGISATKESISQLLWAARGRTPHYYKSRPWGMTIPTWGAELNITSIFLVSKNKVWKYVNWHGNRPLHSLEAVAPVKPELCKDLLAVPAPYDCAIVLGKNEASGRALWEVGYGLLNLMVQARSLGLAYSARLIDQKEKALLKNHNIDDGPSALFLKADKETPFDV